MILVSSSKQYRRFSERLSFLANSTCQHPDGYLLAQGMRGIEKESLRVTPDGKLALSPHPRMLGAALTHPQITTDYSEALLELITPVEPEAALTLSHLDVLHRYIYSKLGNEVMWNESMPCTLPKDDCIPIAEYGTSNIGRFKHIYRRGLALRYGRAMQCIAGIHYNYSLSEEMWQMLQQHEKSSMPAAAYQSEGYMGLLRNFRRYSWLLMLLFGASPAVSSDFLPERTHHLQPLSPNTLGLPYATSLRMSDLGYRNSPEQAMVVDYNSLTGYVDSLARLVNQPHPAYAKIGTHRNGKWVQINTNTLQIENEFYATMRPKRIAPAERPLHALAKHGIQYVEARCLDIDPFEPTGIAAQTVHFLDAFLLFCAFHESPPFTPGELAESDANFARTVTQGRDPNLQLSRGGQSIHLQAWAQELLDPIETVAQALDCKQRAPGIHSTAVATQRAKLDDFSLTPSARIAHLLQSNQQSLVQFALEQSQEHARYFRARPLEAAQQSALDHLALRSLAEQERLEQENPDDFEGYMAAYRSFKLPES
jgi:glutamate--cysteine ligase